MVTILDTFVPWPMEGISTRMTNAVCNGSDPDMNHQETKSGLTLIYGDGMPASPARNVRCAVRFPLALPVTVYRDGVPLPAITHNVSASGVLFETETPIHVGESITFSMRMPGAILGTPNDVLVECRGRVVRCSLSYSLPRVAATIDDYRFVEQ
jgi:hypothetical protein